MSERVRIKADDAAEQHGPEVRRLLVLMRDLGRMRSLRDPVGGSFHEHACGLTPPQVHAVMWIADEQPMTMGVLARRLGITEKTVTGIVDRLEESKVVQRVRDLQDRRVVHVALTDHGHELAAQFVGHVAGKAKWLLALLDPEDQTALFRILETIRDRIGSHESTRGAPEAR